MERVAHSDEKSIRDLISDLTTKTTDLVRKEIQLAKLEISEGIDALQSALVSMAVGGVVVFAGFLVLLAAAVLGLDRLIEEPAVSALIVGSVVTAIGVTMLLNGRRTLSDDKVGPDKIAPSLRQDAELVQKHI